MAPPCCRLHRGPPRRTSSRRLARPVSAPRSPSSPRSPWCSGRVERDAPDLVRPVRHRRGVPRARSNGCSRTCAVPMSLFDTVLPEPVPVARNSTFVTPTLSAAVALRTAAVPLQRRPVGRRHDHAGDRRRPIDRDRDRCARRGIARRVEGDAAQGVATGGDRIGVPGERPSLRQVGPGSEQRVRERCRQSRGTRHE